MKKPIIMAVVATFALFACSQKVYDEAPAYKLCRVVLTKPSINIHYDKSLKAIKKRGIDCDRYVTAIIQEKAAEDARRARNTRNYESQRQQRELDNIKRDLSTQCIMSGGVMVGYQCLR